MRSRAVQPAAFLMLMCSISWHPEGGKKVAIAYSILQFQQQPADMSLSSYVWDVTNPNYPDLELVPASGAACPLLLLHASALLRDWRVTRLRSARVSRVQHQGSAPHSRRLLQRPFAVSLLPNAPFSSDRHRLSSADAASRDTLRISTPLALKNGKTVCRYWDDRKGSAPVESSPIEKSHRDPVYDLCWLQSKTGTEFASVSTDGQILWWDLRKLAEPMER